MINFHKNILLVAGLSALSLSACGEGSGKWEVVPFKGQVPYTEERTAGSGVMYVRAHLLPEKGPVLPATSDPVPEPIKSAEPIFSNKVQKK